MVGLDHVRRYTPPSKTIAVVIANLLPLVGVVALGWDVVALVFLYWLELGVLCFWALTRALFAGRPSELDPDHLLVGALTSKRVGIPIPFTAIRIRLSTLPVLTVAVPMLAFIWFFAGIMTIGVLGADLPAQETVQMVILAGFGMFVSEGISTFIEYFYRQGYRDHSAQTAIQGVFVRGLVITFGGIFTAMLVGLGSGSVGTDDPITAANPTVVGLPLLLGIVLVKFGFDLAGLYRDRLIAFDEKTGLEIGWAYEPPRQEPIQPIESESTHRIRPAVLGRLIGGLSMSSVRRHPAAWFVGLFLALLGALFATGQVWDVVFLFAIGSVTVPLVLVTIDYWIRYGAIEYRLSDDSIVAYDRLFRTRLWRIEPWDESGIRVECDRIDAWLDTKTVIIELSDRELRLPRVSAVEPILAVFDRRVTISE